ncbi:MAG: GtrA family protein [Candidatus Nanohalobium sp.]
MIDETDVPDFLQPLTDLRKGFKFSAASVAGLVLENIFLVVFVELAGSELITAKLVGAEISIAFMFILNNRFTYKGSPGSILTRFLKSNAVRAGGVLIATAVLKIGVSLGVWYLLANVVGVCVGFVFNYGFETLYTWKEHRTQE